jgi:hypothetical protein
MTDSIEDVMDLEVTAIKRKDLPNSEFGYSVLYLTKLGKKYIKLLSVTKHKFEERVGHSVTDTEFIEVMNKIVTTDFCGVNGYKAKGSLNHYYNRLVREFKNKITTSN